MAEKKAAFGGKVVDLQNSGLGEMTISDLFGGEKKTIVPTEIVGAFWIALRTAEVEDKTCYFGTKKELGADLDKDEVKERKAKLAKK